MEHIHQPGFGIRRSLACNLSGPAALVWLMLLRSLAIPSNPNDILGDILGMSGCTEWRLGRVYVIISFVKTDVN